MRRILTAAAAGSAFLAALSPSAQALDFGGTLSGAAQTAAAAGGEVEPVADGALGDKAAAVQGVVKGSTQVVKSGNDLLH